MCRIARRPSDNAKSPCQLAGCCQKPKRSGNTLHLLVGVAGLSTSKFRDRPLRKLDVTIEIRNESRNEFWLSVTVAGLASAIEKLRKSLTPIPRGQAFAVRCPVEEAEPRSRVGWYFDKTHGMPSHEALLRIELPDLVVKTEFAGADQNDAPFFALRPGACSIGAGRSLSPLSK